MGALRPNVKSVFCFVLTSGEPANRIKKALSQLLMKIRSVCLFFAFGALCGALSAAEVYNVSPDGNDKIATGAKDKPFATLAAAYQAAKDSGKDAEIVLAEGVYFFPESGGEMRSYPNSSASQKITGGGKATFVGGVRIPAKHLFEVKNPAFLKRLPAKKEGKLYALDLKKFGIKKLVPLPKMPADNGIMGSEAFYSGGELTLARYPNGKETIKIGEVLDGGWQTAEPGKNKPGQAKIGGIMRYTDERHSRWVDAKDYWLFGIFNPGWLYGSVQVEKIDPKQMTVHVKTLLPWGITTQKKKLDVNAYQAVNLFEEIDANGEYYLDRDNLHFFVMLKDTPPEGAYFDFSLLEKPMLNLNNVENLTVSGVNFTASCTRPIKGRDCVKTVIEDCNFYNLGWDAVDISAAPVDGYSEAELARTNNVVRYCRVFDTGGGGVRLSGGSFEKLLPSHNRIENCEFYNNARWRKSYAPQADLRGVGGFISHCYFHDQTHLSIEYGGSEHTIEYNRFERCCRDFHDMGVTYSGRAPHCAGNVIRGNFFSENEEKTHSMMCGVYVDDGSGGTLIEKNIFCRTGTRVGPFAAIYIHAGKNNISKENVFIDCQASACQLPWSDERWEDYWVKKNPHGVNYANTEIFLKKYPELKDIQNGSLPRFNEMIACRYFRTSLPHGGFWKLSGGQYEMKPREPVGQVDYWSMENVKKYFGNTWPVNEILRAKPGILPKP